MQAVCPECNFLNPVTSKFCGECGSSLDSATVVKPVERAEQGVQLPKEEKTYYSSGSLKVTSTRAILGAKTYAMANITSVSMAHDPPQRKPGIALSVLGLVGIIGSFPMGDGLPYCLGIAAFVTLLGLFIAIFQKHEYIVRIGSASGESDALKSTDKDRIQRIVRAINRAIIERG